MAFALVNGKTKVYPIEVETSFRNVAPHVIECELTALAADTVLNLRTLAAADATNGPAIVTMLDRTEKVLSYSFLESPRAAAAAGAAHSYNGSKTDPEFTFAGGGATPTALTLQLVVKLKKDMPYVKSANQ